MYASLPILMLAGTTTAACACGYSVNNTDDVNHAVFTDLFESDFLHITDVTFNHSYSTGWIPQDYGQPKLDGPYGLAKQARNLIPNFIANRHNWFGEGVLGGDPGLQLWVRSGLIQHGKEQLVPSAEIVSERDDILYGSFRIAMKTTSVEGTCGAFFFYRNESQEIDVEILSSEQQQASENGWGIHLVVQSTHNGPGRDHHNSRQLIYHSGIARGDTDAIYNEFRFDWLPDRIDYFLNSHYMWSVTGEIPSTPGRIHISHWSDGNQYWSRGPPEEDAVLTVSYVKAYFNSTNATRVSEYSIACEEPKGLDVMKNICQIPDQTLPPNPSDNESGHTYFFTQQENMTVNQTVYDSRVTGWSSLRDGTSLDWFLFVPMMVFFQVVF